MEKFIIRIANKDDLDRATVISTKQMVKEGKLSADEIKDLSAVYPKWDVGVEYKVGDVVSFGVVLYEVIQAHTSQSDWKPDLVPALFKSTLPEGEIGEWKQPQGDHDAYNIGDKVTFKGKTYESVIDGNVWSPSAHPAGWKEVN